MMSKKNKPAPSTLTGPIVPAAPANATTDSIADRESGEVKSTPTPAPVAKPEEPKVEAKDGDPEKAYLDSLAEAKAFELETREIERKGQLELKAKLEARKGGRAKVLERKQKAFLAFDAHQRRVTAGSPDKAVLTGDAVTQPVAPLTQSQPLVPPADLPQPTGDPLAPVPNAPTQPQAPLLQRTPEVPSPDAQPKNEGGFGQD